MKMWNYILPLVLWVGVCSCSTSRGTAVNMERLDNLVTNENFEIRARWARPMVTATLSQLPLNAFLPPGSNVNMIDITGTSNYLRISRDSVSAILPFYGERFMGGGYTVDSGVEFDGTPEDYELIKREGKNSYSIKFSINKKTENYRVHVILYPDLTSNIIVNSSHRTRIQYDGHAVPTNTDSASK